MVLFTDFRVQEDTPTDHAWRAECDTVIKQGLAGVALRLIRERSLTIPDEVLDLLQVAQFNDISATTTIVKRSETGIESLRSAGIPFVISKGPGTALEGTSVSDRPYFDLDVVVDPSRFLDAREVLRATGYSEHERSVQAWDSFNRFCREAVNLRTDNGGSIDLHHRISPWCWSEGLTFDVLAAAARPTDVFGVVLPLASREHNLLICALHVVSDKSRPGQTYRIWRDLLVLARSCPADVAAAAAHQTGMTAWLQWILGCLPADVQPTELLDLLAGDVQHVQRSFRLRMLLPPRFGSQHLFGQIFRLPVSHAALFTAGMVVPSPMFLRLRYPEGRHRYLTWWRESLDSFGQETREHALPPLPADEPQHSL
jgi:hypothetical protein